MKGMLYLVKTHLDKVGDSFPLNCEVKIMTPEFSLSSAERVNFEVVG
jgi:hypothetical protein